MKKIICSLFIFSLFFFTGCQSKDEDSSKMQAGSKNTSEAVMSSTIVASDSSEETLCT